MKLQDEEKDSKRLGRSSSERGSSQCPLAEPVAVPARRLPPREGCAPSFRLQKLPKEKGDVLVENVKSLPNSGSCDDPNQMGEVRKRARIPDEETRGEYPTSPIPPSLTLPGSDQQKMGDKRWNYNLQKPKRRADPRYSRAASMQHLSCTASDQGPPSLHSPGSDQQKMVDKRWNDNPQKIIRPADHRRVLMAASMRDLTCRLSDLGPPSLHSPESDQQKMADKRWNDNPEKTMRPADHRLLYRAASMQDLAFTVSDPVCKDILDDDDDEIPIERFTESCISLSFDHTTSDGPDVEVFHKSKTQIDDDEPDIEVFRPTGKPQHRLSSSSRNMKQCMGRASSGRYDDEPDIEVFRPTGKPSPLQQRLSSSSRKMEQRMERVNSGRSGRSGRKQEEEYPVPLTLHRSPTELSPPTRRRQVQRAGSKVLLRSLTDLSPPTRPSVVRRVKSSANDLERSLTELERSLSDLARSRSSEENSRANLERSMADVALTTPTDWERSISNFERSLSNFGLAKSSDLDKNLTELKRSLTSLARVRITDFDLSDSSEERSLTKELVPADPVDSIEQVPRTRSCEDSIAEKDKHYNADLRDNSSYSSISIDDLNDQQEVADKCHPAQASQEKDELSPERLAEMEDEKEMLKLAANRSLNDSAVYQKSLGGASGRLQYNSSASWAQSSFDSSLALSSIYINIDLKNESNSSIQHSNGSFDEIEPGAEMIESAVERNLHDSSSSSSFRNNSSLQGSFGHASSTSLSFGHASGTSLAPSQRARLGERVQSYMTVKEQEHRNHRSPAPTSNPPSRSRPALSRSYSTYSSTNSLLDCIQDVSDEEKSVSDRVKLKTKARRGRRKPETNDAKLAREERELAEQAMTRSLDESFQFEL